MLTCLWQGLWAFLFEASDVATARVLTKLGWIAILPLPTVLYHFAVEVAERPDDHRWLIASYALAAVLVVLLLSSDLVIDGVRRFSFGFYPKAGPLEAVHIAQTTALVLRSIWLLYAGQRHATAEKRRRLQLCLCGVALYSLSAADYAVNYGLAPYPHGVIVIAGSPVIMAFAIIQFDLMRPCALAATVAHEVSAPLATIRLQAAEIARKGHIEISAWPDGDSYVLAIRDSAMGIPPSVQRRIFDPFFSTKPADKGSGVGLTFCRRVMEAFGGRIQCESVVDEYTLFTLRLPRQSAA
ncbi:Sensor histidine kinase RcsC [Ralstonia syzygii subsp. syzygii]|nr:Sensor histidine kinase RcsC [Ralstonia syzygii subsp. syzygii]